jgi:hypothetical protein
MRRAKKAQTRAQLNKKMANAPPPATCSRCGEPYSSFSHRCGAAKEEASSPLDAAACSAWRDPKTDPPTKTGKILVWLQGVGPSLVNVEERWMAYWNGHDETCPTDPDEWDLWAEINKPDDLGMAAGAAAPPLKSD